MTQDEILDALHKVVQENKHYTTWTVSTPHLVALVNLAIEQEREACAEFVDSVELPLVAMLIRARGQA
jgi:bacteriorhodopsin